MGFVQSYLRLPRYQRVVLGVVGLSLGWYGPSLMTHFFLSDSPEDNLKSDKNYPTSEDS